VTYLEPARLDDPPDPPLGITVFGCEPDEADLFHRLAPGCGVEISTTPEPLSEAAAVPLAPARCVSVGHRSGVTGRELEALKAAGVDYLSTRSIGLDHIDVDAATELGITVENVTYSPDGVADFTMMLILMATRNTEVLVSPPDVRSVDPCRGRGRDLRDLTVGVVGVGNIGRAVIRRLQGFGCQVLGCDTGTTAGSAAVVPLDHLLQQSDIVPPHLPLTPETRHVIGGVQIASMRDGAILVNTARGALVDTDALLPALQSGHLRFAALDVVEGEEHLEHDGSASSRETRECLLELQQLPNVILTPHIAYRTERTLRELVERTLVNCVDFERSRAR
jgi:D-specific alpha-keto acid dehydrogenase